MNLYHISQVENQKYDTFDSAVVAAESEDIARLIHPGNAPGDDELITDWDFEFDTWCRRPGDVIVRQIGVAVEGTKRGVICASFNAG